jgi:flagellar assembly protein FliH
MSWSSDTRPRVRVLRDSEEGASAAADLGIVRSAAARALVVDPALVTEALEDGYRAGYDRGFAAGLEDAASAIDARERDRAVNLTTVVDRLATASEELAGRHSAIIASFEGRLVEYAVEIAQALVARELESIDDRGRDAIRRALQLAPPTGPVVARLHPDDVATLGDPSTIVAGRALTVVADPSLHPGDAVVDVGAAHVDGRIGAALARIREALS